MSKIKSRCAFNHTDFLIICDIAKRMNISVEDYVAASTLAMSQQILETDEKVRQEREQQLREKAGLYVEEKSKGYTTALPISDIPSGS